MRTKAEWNVGLTSNINKRFGVISFIVDKYWPEHEYSIDDTPKGGLARSRSGFIGAIWSVPL